MLAIRSLLFYLIALLTTPLYCLIGVLILPLPPQLRYRIMTQRGWTLITMWVIEHVCGIKYVVEGAENIPDRPAVIYSKHQSAWETMALQFIFPPQVYIAKQELRWLPFFGWGLATISTIFIDRKAGVRSKEKMVAAARNRLDNGFWIVIFPEGTRIAPGRRVKYKKGGAELARALDVPLVPVAHNAGEFWARNSWWKRPGTITVSIGRPVYPEGRDATVLTDVAETWIENEVQRISTLPR